MMDRNHRAGFPEARFSQQTENSRWINVTKGYQSEDYQTSGHMAPLHKNENQLRLRQQNFTPQSNFQSYRYCQGNEDSISKMSSSRERQSLTSEKHVRNGENYTRFGNPIGQRRDYFSAEKNFTPSEFVRDIENDLDDNYAAPTKCGVDHRHSQDFQSYGRNPRAASAFNLKGLLQKTECFNKSVDRKVMSETRIRFEEEQLHKTNNIQAIERDMQNLSLSNANIPTRGRGTPFGKLRSVEADESVEFRKPTNVQSSNYSNYNTSSPNRQQDPWQTQQHGHVDRYGSEKPARFEHEPRGTYSKRAHFQSSGKVPVHMEYQSQRYQQHSTPDQYRNHQNAYGGYPDSSNGRRTAVYRNSDIAAKKPAPTLREDNPLGNMSAKSVKHAYYSIVLCGETQKEHIAQRIEKTVRNTESPPEF